MKIGVTIRFQNSYFSGAIPQVACAIARALGVAGHEVTLLYPKGETNWFIDVASYASKLPPRKEWSPALEGTFDRIVEVVWSFSPEDRQRVAKEVFHLLHYPPMFYDIESSVYMWNPSVRKFGGLRGLWTYDHFSKQDVRYLEFLSGLPVQTLPYIWDPDALDHFVRDEKTPSWADSARRVEGMLPADAPRTMSWCARVVESNFSNSSHCTIPLNIVSEIRRRGEAIRFTVHNGEAPIKHAFFQNNVVKNLMLPDLSGNFVPRARLPDLRGDKTFLVAHQRFRPIKSYLLDALYLGIPMLHNSQMIRGLGACYYYEGNQILGAVEAWRAMAADAARGAGFFDERKAEIRRATLVARFSPGAVAAAYGAAVQAQGLPKPIMAAPKNTVALQTPAAALRVAFATMWDDFQPRHNFFMYLLSWVAGLNGMKVELDEANPNLVFFGPFSKGGEKRWPGVPKVYFTGENSDPNNDADTILNLGFRYEMDAMKNKQRPYIRLPLWVLEINWWGADPDKIVNPRPVSVAAATKVDPELLTRSRKFCAFVATNPANPNRNLAFHVLDRWRGVDAGGRLFCNLAGGPIPAGRGGGGGELAKVDFYKNYKFAITFENASSPGYTTEKLFHAKVAGAVPIYWGDPFVDRDFDSAGFLNANRVTKPEDLIAVVEKMADDDAAWRAAAAVPAVSEFKKRWCMNTMEAVARVVFDRVLGRSVVVPAGAWDAAESFAGGAVPAAGPPTPALSPQVAPQAPQPVLASTPATRVFVTAANGKFLEAAVNALASLKAQDTDCRRIIYVWPDVPDEMFSALKQHGATEIRRFPAVAGEWSDYWDPQHFAWKLWIHKQLVEELPAGTAVFYCDAGTVFAGSVEKIWRTLATDGVLLLEDDEQKNERWCHPTFCKNLSVTAAELAGQQLWAGGIGFVVGGAYDAVAKKAVECAKVRETIVGEKWRPYSATCHGHRHDQSILSILTARAGLPRRPLRDFYCDTSMRAAKQFGTPLYVHRGNFRAFTPLTEGIDEAYLINLPRRKDRLETFRATHPTLKNAVYVLPAVDGRSLTLSPELIHCFRDNDFGWKKSVMGCALSHLTLWEKLANDSMAKSYLILEDDVRLGADWQKRWAAAASAVPADADVIYLGGILPPNKAAFPSVVEAVNPYFGRVATNTLYSSTPRRYFHFCNYAYVLTKAGAQKLVKLVKERGIFTSGDHMIVNHGDNLLNIYFTTPLIATCFQDEDPKYVASQFNDFSRVDEFDSDLWNNNERFSKEEVMAVLGQAIKPATQEPAAPQKPTVATDVWNAFMKAVALKRNAEIPGHLKAVFGLWASMKEDEFQKHNAWFRVLEQLLLSKNTVLQTQIPLLLSLVKALPWSAARRAATWGRVLEMYASGEGGTPVFHMKEVDPHTLLEKEWLSHILPAAPTFRAFDDIKTLLEAGDTPIVVYQRLASMNVSPLFTTFARILAAAGKKMIVLHLSDEFGSDDIGFYKEEGVKAVIRNYWRADLTDVAAADKVLVIPLGYAAGRGATAAESPAFGDRANIWSFAGSLDREGRAAALAKLRVVTPHVEEAKVAWSDPSKLDAAAYATLMRNTRFVPCFRGSRALESFRIYEALENGAIPFYVIGESGVGDDELKKVLGADHPLLGFPDWETAARTLPLMATRTDVMEKHRAQLKEWWSAKKQTVRAAVAAALG